MNRGLLLINLGTPASPTPIAVRQYLNEFLLDRRVIDLPWPLRYALVKGIILPFRSRKSAEAYKSIWLTEGSPLFYYSQQLLGILQKKLANDYKVALGMRYGNPSIAAALSELKECCELVILPLYPQYSSAATGSASEKTLSIITQQETIPSIKIISHFYQYPAYIQEQGELIREHLKPNHHLLFSYHGIPERQIEKAGCKKCCSLECPVQENPRCYKAQCYQTTQLIAQHLILASDQYSTAFQSRLGKTPWIKPYTDELLINLAAQGVKNITITCPSFVTDCLETLEEIGLRAKEQWLHLGGQEFNLIPSMNTHESFTKAIREII